MNIVPLSSFILATGKTIDDTKTVKHQQPHVQKPKADDDTNKKFKLNDICRQSPTHHIMWIALISIVITTLRCKPVTNLVINLLSWLPSTGVKTYQPLSLANWILHWLMTLSSLELAGSMYTLMTMKSNDTTKRRTYQGFYASHLLVMFFSMVQMAGHSSINQSLHLETLLEEVFFACNKTYVFGYGLSGLLGHMMYPPLFMLVSLGHIGYHNVMGRFLATYTIYKQFKELPFSFGVFTSLTSVTAVGFPILASRMVTDIDLTSDTYHSAIASALAMNFIAQSVFLNRYVRLLEEEGEVELKQDFKKE